MRLVLYANETPDESTLMHYRVGGEKTGVRRYQDKQGKLTPEGYQHYKEMYGWGDRDKTKGGPAKPESGKKNLGVDGTGTKKYTSLAVEPSEDADVRKRRPVGKHATITDNDYHEILNNSNKTRLDFIKEVDSDLSEAKSPIEHDRIVLNYRPVEIGMMKSRATLERNADHPDLERAYLKKAKDLEDDAKRLSEKVTKQDRRTEPSRSDNSSNEVSEKDFKRELKKLQKLSDNTNIGLQKKEAQKYDLIAKKNLENIVTRTASAGVMTLISGTDFVKGLAMPLASAGMAAYSKARSAIAKQRMTDVGHGKAVEKYNQQFDKMIEMFSGTPYQTLLEQSRNKKIT